MRKLESFFTEDDFEKVSFNYNEDKFIRLVHVRDIANRVLKKEAAKWQRVYSPQMAWTFDKSKTAMDTHTALLAFVEPIKECEHKNVYELGVSVRICKCSDCGAEVRPVKWEVVK